MPLLMSVHALIGQAKRLRRRCGIALDYGLGFQSCEKLVAMRQRMRLGSEGYGFATVMTIRSQIAPDLSAVRWAGWTCVAAQQQLG